MSTNAIAAVLNVSNITFNGALFAQHLTTHYLGRYLHYRESLPSTHTLLRSEAFAHSPTGTIILADAQTAGLGRVASRTWLSAPTGNLYFSFILRPLSFTSLPLLHFAVSTAVVYGIRTVGGAASDAVIKWPNDVHIHRRKVAGILVDTDSPANDLCMYIGIGINVNAEMNSITDATIRDSSTSIRDITNRTIQREILLAQILNKLESLITNTFPQVLSEYISYESLINETLIIMPNKKEDTTTYYDAIGVGYTDDGYLIVKRIDNNQNVTLMAEEVSVRIKPT